MENVKKGVASNLATPSDILKFASDNGMIDLPHIQKTLDMIKRQEILDNHTHKIWQGKDGSWCTYVPDSDAKGGRRFIKKTTKEKLEDRLVELATTESPIVHRDARARTFLGVYNQWRSYHDQMLSNNSISKYNSDIIRFFSDKNFVKRDIKSFTEDDVMVFIREKIRNLSLSKQAAKQLFQYINNVFKFAERHGYIDRSPTRYLEAKQFYKFCSKSRQSGKPGVFTDNEMRLLSERLELDHKDNPAYIPSYAVELASYTGMRVGEIAALTWDCIFDNYILINKSQKWDTINKVYFISDTKTGESRKFPITPEIRSLLDRLRRAEEEAGYLTEWVFSDENGQVDLRKISSCLKNKCKQVGIDRRGIHCYRKTLNSKMRHNGVPTVIAAALLGHSPAVNEQYYTYDVADIAEKAEIVARAVSW